MIIEKKRQSKKRRVLDMKVTKVFVATTTTKRAFIEQFSFTQRNFTQKHLGTLCGFFVARDKSQWSMHIVNFLTAEIKKEYFAVTKRKVDTSFEAALHRGNRALAELAKNDNVNWLGHIDGVVCAYDDTTIHFTTTGDSYVLLIRDNEIIEISQGLASEQAKNNPLKTFVDTASGALQKGDKLIITSSELLDIISIEQLQKNAHAFSCKDFVQFISTVLINEYSLAATMIIDVEEKIIHEQEEQTTEGESDNDHDAKTEKLPPTKNVFDAKTFREKDDTSAPSATPITSSKTESITPDSDKKPTAYTDDRTGHIYIQGDKKSSPTYSTIHFTPMFDHTKDIMSDVSYATKKRAGRLHKKILAVIIRTPKYTVMIFQRILAHKKPLTLSQKKAHPAPVPQKTSSQKTVRQTAPVPKKETSIVHTKKMHTPPSQGLRILGKNFFTNLVRGVHYCKKYAQKIVRKTLMQISRIFDALKKKQELPSSHDTLTVRERAQNAMQKISSVLRPAPRRIMHFWKSMPPRFKLIAIGMLFLIIIIPILIKQSLSREVMVVEQKNAPVSKTITTQTPTSPQNLVDASTILLEGTGYRDVFAFDDTILITRDDKIISIDAQGIKKENSLPTKSGILENASFMEDLSLLFFTTDTGKLFSFSPITGEFIEQTTLVNYDYNKIRALGTYLTYLYTVHDDGITRFARTNTGFGKPNEWLTDNIAFTDVQTINIDDDIYIIQDNTLLKFFAHKQKKFSLSNNISPHALYTTPETKYVWILDQKNTAVIALNKSSGAEEKRVKDMSFDFAKKFVINEKDLRITFVTDDGVYHVTHK